MKQFILNNKKIIGYTVYCFLLIVGFLYLLFPSDTVRDYVQALIQKENPGVLLSIGGVRPALPFGIKLLKNRLSLKTDPNLILFQADSVSIKPRLWAFLHGLVTCRFRVSAYHGHIKGMFHLPENIDRSDTDISMVLNHIRVEAYPLLSILTGCHVKGLLDGTATYNGRGDRLVDGIGGMDITLSDGRLDLLRPIGELGSISFSDMAVKLALKDRIIDLTHVRLNGTEIEASLSGIVDLNEDISRSTLHIKGSIKPLAGLSKEKKEIFDSFLHLRRKARKAELTFVIRGTVEKPAIDLI